ncbi:unnamed protein product [Amoebophrya sp. A120]|nr:unnamed protein product [Amoebophrya sp. A120]|eukprot:GSA120T00006688001.1
MQQPAGLTLQQPSALQVPTIQGKSLMSTWLVKGRDSKIKGYLSKDGQHVVSEHGQQFRKDDCTMVKTTLIKPMVSPTIAAPQLATGSGSSSAGTPLQTRPIASTTTTPAAVSSLSSSSNNGPFNFMAAPQGMAPPVGITNIGMQTPIEVQVNEKWYSTTLVGASSTVFVRELNQHVALKSSSRPTGCPWKTASKTAAAAAAPAA